MNKHMARAKRTLGKQLKAETSAAESLAIGRDVIISALCMKYAAADKATPVWARYVIKAALAYVALPPVASRASQVARFADDVGVLTSTSSVVSKFFKPGHIKKARQHFRRLSGFS